jgi:NTE family protein
MAHVGALSVLQQAGIPVDVVVGTSAGAIMGAFYCAGMELCLVEELAAQISWRRVAQPVLSSKGLISLAPMQKWMIALLGDLHFEDLALPFACATTDMQTGQSVVVNRGPLAVAVQASCSVPGIITPVAVNGRYLSDGGITNNIPVSVVREMGADYVIGIDIFEPRFNWPLGPLGMGLSAIEIMVENAGGGTKTADCLITPNLCGLSYIRFAHRHKLMQLGRQAALAQLPKIQQDLGLTRQF